ncbi:hypothetical protein AMATHDRAFT_11534 [Amanita thiersii Skay4041]|uniref:Uncharacterized protein n=1 Tax=Amanita thiersii Skay4041 TaxID=703135 RepID=A0A2A9N8Z1_9AGAR|nr:hypothetical protein AMATHDRAFT_11534 [Amanita thiersii Skay4041]
MAGLLILKTDEDGGIIPNDGHKVWVRPSQTKIQYPITSSPDPAHCTLDLLHTSYISSPS